jgi:putative transposase
MASAKTTSPEAFLLDLLPPKLIRSLACSLRVVQRRRDIDILTLVLVVALTVQGRGKSSFAEMHRAYERRTGTRLARSSFTDRLTPALTRLVQQLLRGLMKDSRDKPPRLLGFLASFKDLVAVDASVVQVSDSLADVYKGTATPAAIKLHTFVRPLTGELLSYRLTEETRPDCKVFGVSHDVRGKLLLLDRGYADGSLWWRIHRLGAFFVTRYKTSFTARVVSVNDAHRGSRTRPLGMPIKDLIKGRAGGRIDVNCTFAVRTRPYGSDKGRRFTQTFRVVGVYNKPKRRYQLYVTNVSPDRLSAEQVAATYRLRWDVERFFTCLKTGMGLRKINTGCKHRVQLVVAAALLRCTVAMRAMAQAERYLPNLRWINPLQWVQVWREWLGELLRPWVSGTRPRGRVGWERLALIAMDPNRKRRSARVLATMGLHREWAWHRGSGA